LEVRRQGTRGAHLADLVAHAPERRQRRAEAARGGRRARQRPRLRQPHAAPRRRAPRMARRRRLSHRQRRRCQRSGPLAEHGEWESPVAPAIVPALVRELCVMEMDCAVGLGSCVLLPMHSVRIDYGFFCDELTIRMNNISYGLSMRSAAFAPIGWRSCHLLR
jgi:hypothetical protein